MQFLCSVCYNSFQVPHCLIRFFTNRPKSVILFYSEVFFFSTFFLGIPYIWIIQEAPLHIVLIASSYPCHLIFLLVRQWFLSDYIDARQTPLNFPTILIIENELAQTRELLSMYGSLISEYENGESWNWCRNIEKNL